MKQTLVIAMAAALMLTGCAVQNSAPEEMTVKKEPDVQPLSIQTEVTPTATEVGFRIGDEYLSIDLPADWGFNRVDPQSSESFNVPGGCSGVMLYRSDGNGGTMTLLHYPHLFGVCGTGLEEKKLTVSNGVEATVGYYDGNPDWSFVSFRALSESCAAENHGLSGADAEAALGILSTVSLTPFEMRNRFESVSEMLEYWETFDCEPEWISSISSTSGGDGITILLVAGYDDRAAELRAKLADDSALTVETGGRYSDLELKRINREIADNYMPPADGIPVIAGCGVGWHIVDGEVVGFGESGRENRVVAEVLREHAEEYRELFARLYGDRVVVEETDGFATFD